MLSYDKDSDGFDENKAPQTDVPLNRLDKADRSEDAGYVLALSQGDHDAFDKIFLKYYSRTLNFVCSLVKREEDAEDIVEDIFVWLWTNRTKLDPSKSFNAFLYTIARNSVFNYFRSKKVRGNYNNTAPETEQSFSSDEEFIAKETELLIKLAVGKMPQQRRKVFELKHNEDLSNSEIAERLGISVKAVEKQMRLALADIRQVVTAFLALLFFQNF